MGAVIQQARLESQILDPAEGYCVRLWFYFNTTAAGKLSVDRQVSGHITDTLKIVKASDVTHNDWHVTSVSVAPYSEGYSVLIIADTGSAVAGLVAVDDVSVTHGECQGGPTSACQDIFYACEQFGPEACLEPHILWAKLSCTKYCGFCEESTSNP
ncbi:hypothetical protein BaRGS_00003745 [Batillaria attramentaria]|uniref:MAM domain-containing protein n=1 Tax=Batillaria attramentaria TaxID=370345 RepID=A0ABD0LZY3_9CAEN